NWHWDEPSCGTEMCVVLYHQPSAPPDEEGHFLFQWNDDNCNSKNNYVCKYTESEQDAQYYLFLLFLAVVEIQNCFLFVVSLSDNISYILYATIPVLLLLLVGTVGFFCYKHHVN
ncbi:hypothetical protein NL108_014465, partial [Boleophthalmus pectinirostris]